MRVLLETESFEMIDTNLTSLASRQDIIKAAEGYDDIIRIWVFDNLTETITDITARLVPVYEGGFNENSPPWVKRSPLFDDLCSEEQLDHETNSQHIRSFKDYTLYV